MPLNTKRQKLIFAASPEHPTRRDLGLAFGGRCDYQPPSRGTSQACAQAALAQLVEHIIRNDGVRCSSHLSGTNVFSCHIIEIAGFPIF
jgi:hypothetical protein